MTNAPTLNADRASRGIRQAALVMLLAGLALLAGCFDRKQSAIINPDGSGKMTLETVVAVPSQAGPGKQKPTAVSFGRQVAADLINNTLGMDAWSEVQITETDGGRARIVATGYFRDLNAVRFHLLPLTFSWKRDPDGTGAAFTIQRSRTPANSYASVTDEDVKRNVAQTKSDYTTQQPTLKIQLEAFSLEMHFDLPGEVTGTTILTREGNTVSLTLDGKKAFKALDAFMNNDAALTATFKAGQDSAINDDILLESIYGQKGPISAHVKLPADAKAAFDYRTEARVAQLGQDAMLKEAGVELIPTFIVNETQPASRSTSQPATPRTPARGR